MIPDIKTEIRKVLEELLKQVIFVGGKGELSLQDKPHIDRALTAIDTAYKKWMMECVGEDSCPIILAKENRLECKSVKHNCSRQGNCKYENINIAKAEIRERIK